MRNSLPDLMYQIEKTIVENALLFAGGNVTYAAEILRINRTTIHNMIHRLNINKEKIENEYLENIIKENKEQLAKRKLDVIGIIEIEDDKVPTLREISEKYATKVLDRNLGNKSKTAKELNVSVHTLKRLINKNTQKRLNL